MADVTGASLSPIYDRLNSAPQYHPLDADTFADWSLEAGDIVTISRDGRSYQSPVHNSTVTWKKKQQVSVSSTGNEKRESVAKMSRKRYNGGSGGLRNSEYQHIYVEDQYKNMRAGLELTASSAALYVVDNYKAMKSGLDLTSSSAALYVQDNYKAMKSGLALTSSSAALYVVDNYKAMKSGLDLTSSSAALYVVNKYSQMQSGLKLTESSARLYVENKYSQMSSGLNLTSSSAALYVNNKYSQMSSGLNLTSSSAALYVNNKYSQMKSGLELSESSARLYVESKYSQMSSGLELTESSARLYAKSADNAAEIVARINESTGDSEIHLNADKVYIGNQKSTTVISGKCSLSDVTADYIQTKISSIASLNVASISSERGGANMYSIKTTTFEQADVTCYVPNGVWDMSLVDNQNGTYTLKRKRFNDSDWVDVGTFNRGGGGGTTLKGTWSNGSYTVSEASAEAGGVSPPISTTIGLKSCTWDGVTGTVSIGYEDPVSGNMVATGCTFDVQWPTTDEYNSGWVDGWNAYENTSWKTPTDTPPAGQSAGFYVPNPKSARDDPLTYKSWDRAYSSVKWSNGSLGSSSTDPGSSYTQVGSLSSAYNYAYFTVNANGASHKYKIKINH